MKSDPTPESPPSKPPQAHEVTVITMTGMGDVPEQLICEILRRIPNVYGMAPRKIVIGHAVLSLAAERAILEEEAAKREKPTMLAHMIKRLRKLSFHPSPSGTSTSEFPIPGESAN
jgi:hypothetical protein